MTFFFLMIFYSYSLLEFKKFVYMHIHLVLISFESGSLPSQVADCFTLLCKVTWLFSSPNFQGPV